MKDSSVSPAVLPQQQKQHTAKHLVLQDGGRRYLGGFEELMGFVQSTVAPPFDRSEDDRRDWVAIAHEQCEVRQRQKSEYFEWKYFSTNEFDDYPRYRTTTLQGVVFTISLCKPFSTRKIKVALNYTADMDRKAAPR